MRLRRQRTDHSRGGPRGGGLPERSPIQNAFEKKWIESTQEKTGQATDLELLQKTLDRMK